jgi:hypothetical protein
MAGLALPWRNGATKALLVMGDAPPHDPEPSTGYTRTSVAAAAKAVDPAAIYSINIGGGGSPYFENLAADSDGHSYTALDPSSAVDQITTAIGAITSSAVTLDPGGPYTGAVGEPITFTADLAGLDETTPVHFAWDFDGDGVYDQATELPTVTHTFTERHSGTIGVAVWAGDATAEAPTATATTQADIATPTTAKYTGQRAGTTGRSVHLQAFVYDPLDLPLAGIPVTLNLGDDATCLATTDSDGKAVCDVLVPGPPGRSIVSAVASPTQTYFRSADAASFNTQH